MQNAVSNHEYRRFDHRACGVRNESRNALMQKASKNWPQLKTQGILAPLLVRELEESKYEVVAGHVA